MKLVGGGRDILEIQYATSLEFRNQKIGQKILLVICEYLFTHFQKLQKIKAVIDRSNYASRKIATKAGFLEDKKDDFYIYCSKKR